MQCPRLSGACFSATTCIAVPCFLSIVSYRSLSFFPSVGAIASLPLVNTKRPARSHDFVTGIAGGDAGGAVASCPCPCVWAAVEWRRGVVGEPEPHVLPVRELWRLNARNTVWLSELLFVTNHGSTSKRKIWMVSGGELHYWQERRGRGRPVQYSM